MDIVVQPGINWVDMNNTIRNSGLFLPMNPSPTVWFPQHEPNGAYRLGRGSQALIGGMVATNCSGTNAVRYGTTKDWVINLTVVLADGSIIKTRHRPHKTSTGYNLASLFTGSEGTLGLITQITLKLASISAEQSVAVAIFRSVRDAVEVEGTVSVRCSPADLTGDLPDEHAMLTLNWSQGEHGI
ncbi:hypothetical protein BDW71DRAFT_204882 [Aspergillus fruticulosus]